jgi:hypothetical protein
MSLVIGLPLIGVLLILFFVARNVGRNDRLRRRRRERKSRPFYWQSRESRSERSQMREDSDPTTIANTTIHPGTRPRNKRRQ